jgi:ornithine carbamoyltransferase
MSGTVVNLHGRSFLNLGEFTPHEIVYLLDLAAELKADKNMVATVGD